MRPMIGLVPVVTLPFCDATTPSTLANCRLTGNRMRKFLTARFFPGAVLCVVLCGPQSAPAQPIAVPARPVAVPSPRAAACHNGLSFDRFLPDLKQQAVPAGVSQRPSSETSPYPPYDQGILHRAPGPPAFG